jgi:hypothetical protein
MDTSITGHPTIDIVLPTYRLDPEEDEKFYPSKAKAIAEKIVADELGNQTSFHEEDSKSWGLNISDKVRDAVKSMFY